MHLLLLSGTFPQWLRSYYHAIRYFVRAHTSAPPLVSEALNVLKSLPTRKKNWYTRISAIIMKYTQYQYVDARQTDMNVVKRNLWEAYIAKWNEQLWNDNRTCQNGGNKLRIYQNSFCLGILLI